MRIRCWGSRGSVPVSGKEYIRYGGDTTCIEIRTLSDHVVIIDAGTGIRRLGHRLMAEDRWEYHLIFTHAHWDHIMGFPFFRPLFNPRTRLHMYRCPISRFVKTMLTTVMNPPFFPIRYSEARAEISYAPDDICESRFTIGSLAVDTIPLSHPNTGRGYKFIENGKVFVFLTDSELAYDHPGRASYEDYVAFCRDADLLVHDAEYTPEEYDGLVSWGHSAYTHALDLALDAKVKRLGLFHLNQDRTDDQVDDILADSRRILAARGSDMDCFAVSGDMEIEV